MVEWSRDGREQVLRVRQGGVRGGTERQSVKNHFSNSFFSPVCEDAGVTYRTLDTGCISKGRTASVAQNLVQQTGMD